MKILAVGDLHGKFKLITKAVDKFKRENYDHLIFMGDYTDSKDKSLFDHSRCLRMIADVSIEFPNDVTCLIGNHDHPNYIYNITCSGFCGNYKFMYKDHYDRGNFKVAFQYKSWLFTHAGIVKGWHSRNKKYINSIMDLSGATNLGDALNDLWLTSRRDCLFDVGLLRGGSKFNGGPFWADKLEMWKKPLEGYNQVVGHTRVPCKTKVTFTDGRVVHFIDCLKEGESDDFNFLTLEL